MDKDKIYKCFFFIGENDVEVAEALKPWYSNKKSCKNQTEENACAVTPRRYKKKTLLNIKKNINSMQMNF